MATPVPNPYFLYPWALASDGTVDTTFINSTGADSGTVNYQYGWTPNYELASDNPSSLPVPRPSMNQLFLDITYALQQLQLQGAPLWVAPATGSPPVGGPANYPLYAVVAYNAGSGIQIYESQIGSNTSVPGADDNWAVISGNAQGVQAGTILFTGGFKALPGTFVCNGATVSRSDYPALMNAIVNIQSCTINSTTTVTVTDSSQMYVGQIVDDGGVYITNTPTPTTIASITNSTTIVLSQTATGSTTENINFFYWGQGDGSTTYTLPNYQGFLPFGSGGSVITGTGGIGTAPNTIVYPGQSGGRAAVVLSGANLPPHAHSGLFALSVSGASNSPGSNTGFTTTPANTGNGPGTSAGFNILPNIKAGLFCIKY